MKEETFFAYHAVTEQPMYLGQHIIFDEKHHNGVYKRVMYKADIVNDIYNNPLKYYGQELEYPVIVALRELALEEKRKEKFPDYPSRLGCIYVSNTLEEAMDWAKYFLSLKRPTFHVVKFKITGKKFMGDATKCFDATTDKAANLELAEKYWQNNDNPDGAPPINEIIVSGDIEVVEIVKEIQKS